MLLPIKILLLRILLMQVPRAPSELQVPVLRILLMQVPTANSIAFQVLVLRLLQLQVPTVHPPHLLHIVLLVLP